MREKLKQISKNQFLRNVSTLAMGTVISQIIVVLSSLVLARVFSVESFGNLSVFTSITVFLAVVSTGRYEFAIGLPDSDEKAKKIMKLISIIGVAVSIFYFLIIILLKDILKINDATGFLMLSTSYLAPLYIYVIALFSAFGYWYQRKKQYKKISIANAIQVITTAVLSMFFGFLKVENGMIFSLIIGASIGCFFYYINDKNMMDFYKSNDSVISVAKEYQSFPRYMVFSDLSLVASQQFIPILFSFLYSTTVVGFFSMANRMLRLPNIMITTSIANVFRNDAIDEIRLNGNCKSLYLSTFKKLTFMSVPIYIFLFIASPYLFSFFFGKEWYTAGVYARIISIMLLFEFIAMPLSTLFNVREKQKVLMRIQAANAILGAIFILIGSYFFNDPKYSLIFFAINALFFSTLLIFLSFKLSKQ